MTNYSSDKLWNYVFHFNHFKKEWAVIHRDEIVAYFNNGKAIYKSKSFIKLLIKIIKRK